MKHIFTIFFVDLLLQSANAQNAGRPDSTFDADGLLLPQFSFSDDYCNRIHVLSDGKILLGGDVDSGTNSFWAMTRLLPDGSIDNTFGNKPNNNAGYIQPGFQTGKFGQTGNLYDFDVLDNNRIVLVGSEYKNTSPYKINGDIISEDGAKLSGVTFAPPTSANFQYATSVEGLPNGKSVVGINSSGNCFLQRFNANGSLDNTFGTNGSSTSAPGHLDNHGLRVGTDGSVMGITAFHDFQDVNLAICRWLPDGKLDPSFGVGGIDTVDFNGKRESVWDFEILPSGKILVLARFTSAGSTLGDMLLLRFLENGQPDLSFGGGTGYRVFDINQENDYPIGLQMLTDGKIVILTDVISALRLKTTYLLRLLPDGNDDPDFGNNGLLELPSDNLFPYSDIALAPEGNLLLAGNKRWQNAHSDFYILKITPEGVSVPDFGQNGRVQINIGRGVNGFTCGAVQPNGNLLLGGWMLRDGIADCMVGKYQPDGSPDTTFGLEGNTLLRIDGIDFHDIHEQGFNDMALQSDGRIVAVGRSQHASQDRGKILLARFLPNGDPDSSFQVDGGQFITWNGPSSAYGDHASSVAVQLDGKILVAGTYDNAEFALARYLPDGSPDATFGAAGLKHFKVPGTVESQAVQKMALGTDGKIYLAGTVKTSNSQGYGVVRLLANGQFDNSFGTGGFSIIELSGFSSCHALTLQTDGKVLVSGYSYTSPSQYPVRIVRLLSNGAFDPNFGQNGVAMFEYGAGPLNGWVSGMAVQFDGKIVYTCPINGQFAVGRINRDGTQDVSFGNGGLFTTAAFPELENASLILPQGVAIQPDGNIVAFGIGNDSEGEAFSIALRLLAGPVLRIGDLSNENDKVLWIYPNPVRGQTK